MEAITPALIVVGAINLLMFPVLAWIIKRSLGAKLDAMDEARELARKQREDDARLSRMWRDAMESGMKSLLRAELLHENRKWAAKGYCPFESKQYLERLHDAYKGVGGNSLGDRLYEQTVALPTTREGGQ